MSDLPTGPPVPFTSLPTPSTSPLTPYNAWSVYGPDDELGFLNRQIPALVAAAASSEIRTGVRVSLNAALDFQGDKPLFNRQAFHKDVYQKKPRVVHDDTWSFNTQSSSQWDGLRHFGYQKAARFYNDTTLDDISGASERTQTKAKTEDATGNNILGIQNQARHGIVGRGVLVDVKRWMDGPGASTVASEDRRPKFDSFQTSGIPLDWLVATLNEQKTHLKYGDILVVRTGFMPAYHALSESEIDALAAQSPPGVGGVEQSEAMLRWIWDHFSAVAGDQPGFERWPPPTDRLGWSMHEVLLAGWGCPIGELFDLEALADHCARESRWSFFLVSEPTMVPGGVASPPNVLAIF